MTENDNRKCTDLDYEGVVACSSNKFGINLGIQPKKISLPSEVEITVTNQMDVPYRFAPNIDPVVFVEEEEGWEKFPLAGRLRFPEHKIVNDSFTFKKQIPYSNWNPKPGRYLLLIHGQVLTGETRKKVNVTDKIEVV